MVCLGNICINTLEKGAKDDDDDNNNNNNNNNCDDNDNNNHAETNYEISTTFVATSRVTSAAEAVCKCML
jgi:hypothetical protein